MYTAYIHVHRHRNRNYTHTTHAQKMHTCIEYSGSSLLIHALTMVHNKDPPKGTHNYWTFEFLK